MASEITSPGNGAPSGDPSLPDEGIHTFNNLTISLYSPMQSTPEADSNIAPILDPTKPLQETTKGAARPNHNLQVSKLESVPPWYISNPVQRHPGHPQYTCNTCQHINLDYLFRHSQPMKTSPSEDYIKLGLYSEIAEQKTCALCRIVTATNTLNIDRAEVVGNLDSSIEQLLSAKW